MVRLNKILKKITIISFNINGKICWNIKPIRGIRLADPLSSYYTVKFGIAVLWEKAVVAAL